MLFVYVAALIIGGGVIALQLALGHHDAAVDGSHDAGGADHEASLLTFIGSLRFWAFALLAFGIVGALVTLFAFAGPGFTAALASACGLASGATAVVVVRRLTDRTASSHATSADIVGHVARVTVPPNERGIGKVRVQVKGAAVDYIARAKEPMDTGDAVIVEEVEGAEVVVSKAPKELKP